MRLAISAMIVTALPAAAPASERIPAFKDRAAAALKAPAKPSGQGQQGLRAGHAEATGNMPRTYGFRMTGKVVPAGAASRGTGLPVNTVSLFYLS